MLVDNPEAIAAALPEFCRRSGPAWQPHVPGGFLAALGRELGASQWHLGQGHLPGEDSAAPFWQDLVLMSDSAGSQYDALRRCLAASADPPGNTACLALTGQGFHGQHQRDWTVVSGNLHLSAVLTCDLPAAHFAPVLPALPAVAVAEAVTELGRAAGTALEPRIKWVNDLLLDRRKLAGVLTAVRTHRSRVTAVVVGVGLNVGAAPQVGDGVAAGTTDGPRALPAVALAAVLPDSGPSLGQVLATVLHCLARRFVGLQERGPEDLLAAYRAGSAVIGQDVTVWPETGPAAVPLASGRVTGIGPDLSLELAGRAVPLTSGRLEIRELGT